MREDIFEVGPEGMTVQDLASMLAVNATEIVKFLFMKGIMVRAPGTAWPPGTAFLLPHCCTRSCKAAREFACT